MPLPEDTGLRGDGRPKVRRFRSHRLELGEGLAAFRARYGVTQAEIARAIGACDRSAVSQWESGVNVPDGMLWERLAALVEGRRWPELRAAMLADAGEGLPGRDIATKDALSRHYGERAGDWAPAVVARRGLGDERRLELAHGQPFDLGQSLVPQLPLTLLDAMAEAL